MYDSLAHSRRSVSAISVLGSCNYAHGAGPEQCFALYNLLIYGPVRAQNVMHFCACALTTYICTCACTTSMHLTKSFKGYAIANGSLD